MSIDDGRSRGHKHGKNDSCVGIFVPVSNLKRSTDWYIDKLGFEITHRDEPEAIVMKLNDEKVMFVSFGPMK
ncbi:VOC family protein [Paenibacillus glucanolyticus]|uniref:VOC family protein n=1 Tax=Paenibacillus TaxID=44249 RepID=UPI002E12A970